MPAPYYFKGDWGTSYPYTNCYCYKRAASLSTQGLKFTKDITDVQNGLNAPDGWKWELQGKALVLVQTP